MNPASPLDTEHFATTRWTLLQRIDAQPRGSSAAQAALQQLRDLYWTPVLGAIEHMFPPHRYPSLDTTQLTHEFFAHLTGATVLSTVRQPAGNFREWLRQLLLEFCRQRAAQLRDDEQAATGPEHDAASSRRHMRSADPQ